MPTFTSWDELANLIAQNNITEINLNLATNEFDELTQSYNFTKLANIIQALSHNHTITEITLPTICSERHDDLYKMAELANDLDQLFKNNSSLRKMTLTCWFLRHRISRELRVYSLADDADNIICLQQQNSDHVTEHEAQTKYSNLPLSEDKITTFKRGAAKPDTSPANSNSRDSFEVDNTNYRQSPEHSTLASPLLFTRQNAFIYADGRYYPSGSDDDDLSYAHSPRPNQY